MGNCRAALLGTMGVCNRFIYSAIILVLYWKYPWGHQDGKRRAIFRLISLFIVIVGIIIIIFSFVLSYLNLDDPFKPLSPEAQELHDEIMEKSELN